MASQAATSVGLANLVSSKWLREQWTTEQPFGVKFSWWSSSFLQIACGTAEVVGLGARGEAAICGGEWLVVADLLGLEAG